MTRPLSPTRVLLVADRRTDASASRIRRYRLARLGLELGRPVSSRPPHSVRRAKPA